jgi:hypothetical protein
VHKADAARLLRATLAAMMPAAALAALAGALISWSQPVSAFFGPHRAAEGVNFVVFYSAAKLVAGGHASQLYDLQALMPLERAAHAGIPQRMLPLPYLNPPFFALLLAPLGHLSFGRAYQVWTGITLVVLAADCWMIWRIAAALDRRYRVAAVLLFAALQPVAYSLLIGQFSLILVASWSAAFLSFRAGHDRAGGLALAPLLIKPELLLPVVLLLAWKRRTAALAALTAAAVAATVVSVTMVGVHGTTHYPSFVLNATPHPGHGIGWNDLAASLPSGAGMWPRACAYAALSLATLAATTCGWRGDWRGDGSRFASRWMILTLCTVLIDPHFYIQDVALVMPVGIAVAGEREGAARIAGAAALCVGWALLEFMTVVPEWRLRAVTLCMAGGLLWLVADTVACARRAGKERRPTVVGDGRHRRPAAITGAARTATAICRSGALVGLLPGCGVLVVMPETDAQDSTSQ